MAVFSFKLISTKCLQYPVAAVFVVVAVVVFVVVVVEVAVVVVVGTNRCHSL